MEETKQDLPPPGSNNFYSPRFQPGPGLSEGGMAYQEEEHEQNNAPNPGDTNHDRKKGEDDASLEEKKKPNLLARAMTKLGLDAGTLITMFKGSLPPTIGVAILQAPAVSAYFSTLGYLVAIISVLAMVVMPRGKFLMNLVLNTIAVCFGSAVSLLALWSAIKARQHTTPPGLEPPRGPMYNSSHSAVCAVWLFANIWLCNTLRAKLPAFNLPVITYSILVNVSMTFGPRFPTVLAARVFVQQLLTAMLAALGLALAVNLLVFPVSSRLVVFKEFTGGIGLLRKLVSLQKAYLASLESNSMFSAPTRTETFMTKGDGELAQEDEEVRLSKEEAAAKALEGAGASMKELMSKMHVDLPFAKRDIAWGKLDAKDLSEMFKLFRNVYIPLIGMNTILDIFKRFSQMPDWDGSDEAPEEKDMEKHVWNEVMKQIQEPFEILSEAIDLGLQHVGIVLELLPKPKKKAGRRPSLFTLNPSSMDVEAGEELKPGDLGFARVVDDKVQAFHSRKGELLRTWIQERGVDLGEGAVDSSTFRSERDQVQLYIILYMENLMHATGEAVQDLVSFADEKVEDGTMTKKRLILPSVKRLKKWFLAEFKSRADSSAEQAAMESPSNIVYFGDGYNKKRDPEHLPPATTWEHFGNKVRKIGDFFGSEESAFGFRVACATLTIGIVAYLEPTQQFFMQQRLVWAMIAISLGMTMTSGQSVFGFLCRVGGTVLAMILSFIIWYIVNGSIPGVIVFLWLSIFINYYFFIKYPRFLPAILITIITQVLIVGYELQVLAIGRAAAERSGQPFYPTYLIAPYRVACVAGGSLVAFIWTIFPKPLTDRTWLRRDLSATLYLLANYFGIISSTLKTNVHGSAGDVNMPGTPAHHLFKTGYKVFRKILMLIPSMSQHSEWQKWEPTVGGKFPREAYDEIIRRCNRITSYLTLTTYTLMHPTRVRFERDRVDNDGERLPRRSGRGNPASLNSRCSSISSSNREWLSALSDVLEVLKPTHHTILSTLTLLSNALLSGQSLPPFLPLPRPYEMTRQLMRMGQPASAFSVADEGDGAPIVMVNSRTGEGDYRGDACRDSAVTNILSPRNLEQQGYSEFAVFQICTTLVCDDLEGLMKAVSGLVGVVDFSFRVNGSESSLDLAGGDNGKGKRD